MSEILVVDSSWLLFRSRYLLDLETNKTDIENGILFGFFWSLKAFAAERKTTKFIFCFDSGGNKRKEIFPAYKQNRREKEKTKEEIRMDEISYDLFHKVPGFLEELGFANIYSEWGYESDDLIASILLNNSEYKNKFVILSNDGDLYQLLPYCKGMINAKGFINAEEFKVQHGIRAKDWPLVKAWAGCKTDNVPGIKGFGEATAIKFIKNPPQKGVLAQRFYSEEGKKIIERNKVLTTLPFHDTPKIRIKTKDRLDFDNFLHFTTMYNIEGLYAGNKSYLFWEAFFENGGFR
jgi:5'-3' exonuclease